MYVPDMVLIVGTHMHCKQYDIFGDRLRSYVAMRSTTEGMDAPRPNALECNLFE